MELDLSKLREEINETDREIIELFRKRMQIAASIAEYKKTNGLPVLDAERERALLEKISKQAGEELGDYARTLYVTMMEVSKAYQQAMLDADKEISANTENTSHAAIGYKDFKCGLIGRTLAHSFSPVIHRELADYSYKLFEMEENEVEAFLKSDVFDAINVTIPYKKTVMPYLDEISDEAMRIGSVNTITRTENGGLRGDNTDYYGFWHTVLKGGIEIKDKNVLILGTGGASLTARTVAHDMGARSIRFVSRAGEINYENVYSLCSDAQVVINCTPVGMYPHNGVSPIDLERLPECLGVIDMIYNPARTQLLLDAERLGIRHINGLTMLVAQAKKACELFLGNEIEESKIDRITSLIASETGNIVLVGMPGCGKTTVGSALAAMTGRKLTDTDCMIAQSCSRSPSEIITEEGEEAFRKIEHRQVMLAGKMSGMIISTGGGVVTRDENYAPLHQNGIIVYIKRDLSKLDTSSRPLSQKNKLEDMLRVREPKYMRFCDFCVTNDDTPESCASEILKKLGKEY